MAQQMHWQAKGCSSSAPPPAHPSSRQCLHKEAQHKRRMACTSQLVVAVKSAGGAASCWIMQVRCHKNMCASCRMEARTCSLQDQLLQFPVWPTLKTVHVLLTGVGPLAVEIHDHGAALLEGRTHGCRLQHGAKSAGTGALPRRACDATCNVLALQPHSWPHGEPWQSERGHTDREACGGRERRMAMGGKVWQALQ